MSDDKSGSGGKAYKRQGFATNVVRELNYLRLKADMRFRVELKAWIAQAELVDPEEPLRPSNWPDTVPNLVYEYKSRYRGDNHVGYTGTHRVLSWIEFDWDGSKISNVTGSQGSDDFGITRRDYSYIVAGVNVHSGTESGQATHKTWSGVLSSNTFQLGMAVCDPLVNGPAPNVDATVKGELSGANLYLDYATDLFPSYGIRVQLNGKDVLTSIILDASGVDTLGYDAAVGLAVLLNAHFNFGKVTVPF